MTSQQTLDPKENGQRVIKLMELVDKAYPDPNQEGMRDAEYSKIASMYFKDVCAYFLRCDQQRIEAKVALANFQNRGEWNNLLSAIMIGMKPEIKPYFAEVLMRLSPAMASVQAEIAEYQKQVSAQIKQ